MSIHCMVFIDGSLTSESHTFASVPQVGDSIQVTRYSDPQLLTVVSVSHVAEGTYEEAPRAHAQVNVSSKRASNADRT